MSCNLSCEHQLGQVVVQQPFSHWSYMARTGATYPMMVKLKLNNGCALGHIRFAACSSYTQKAPSSLEWSRGTGDTLNYREMDKHIRPGHERANSLYTRCRCPRCRRPPPDDELQIDIIAKYFQSDYFTPVGKSIIITISLKSHLNVHTAERSMSWVCACVRTGCQWGSVVVGVGGRCDWWENE